jgi:hypothetical protein
MWGKQPGRKAHLQFNVTKCHSTPPVLLLNGKQWGWSKGGGKAIAEPDS